MTFPDLTPELKAAMPQLRGRLLANQSLAELTWFRVGGPAQVLFTPADEDDLAYFLKCLPKELPVYVVGVGSNLIVRDGGIPGVVIRLHPRLRRNQHAGRRRNVRRRRPRQAGGGDGGISQYQRHGISLRYPGHHRRRASDECRSQWQRDHGCAD